VRLPITVLYLCLTDLDCCEQIKLSTKSFGTDAAEVAAKGIANIVATLEEADLSDVIAGPQCQRADRPRSNWLSSSTCALPTDRRRAIRRLLPGTNSVMWNSECRDTRGCYRRSMVSIETLKRAMQSQGVLRTRRCRRCASWRLRWLATRSCAPWTSATMRWAKRASAPSLLGSPTRSSRCIVAACVLTAIHLHARHLLIRYMDLCSGPSVYICLPMGASHSCIFSHADIAQDLKLEAESIAGLATMSLAKVRALLCRWPLRV